MKMKNRKLNRLTGYDYSKDNLYFITFCVQDRRCCFGEIHHKQMILNKYGEIAAYQWQWLTEQYSYIVSHAFVVMPNHIHLIIEINRRFMIESVGTGRDLSLRERKIKSISELMGAYKTTSSKEIHIVGLNNFAWQRSFYDHIIRDDGSYQRIKNYISSNPSNWKADTFCSG